MTERALEYLRQAVAEVVNYKLTGNGNADDAQLIDRLAELGAASRLLIAAGDAAWQDLADWNKTARGLRERSTHPKGPDYDNVPHQRGIDDTEKIIAALGKALEQARQVLEP